MKDGKYPIMLDGELCGALEVSHRGALTVFSAVCAMRDELLRISVYDSEGEGYLGVMSPENGELRLKKTLSRTAMLGFPQEIAEVTRSGAGRAFADEQTGSESGEEEHGDHSCEAEAVEISGDGLHWYSSPDGILVTGETGHAYAAIPIGDERLPRDIAGIERKIEGRDYLVFALDDGRLAKAEYID